MYNDFITLCRWIFLSNRKVLRHLFDDQWLDKMVILLMLVNIRKIICENIYQQLNPLTAFGFMHKQIYVWDHICLFFLLLRDYSIMYDYIKKILNLSHTTCFTINHTKVASV